MPQATRSFRPRITPGSPGSVTPSTRRPAITKRIGSQIPGIVRPRWGSLARRGLPLLESAPETAHAFEPRGSSSRSVPKPSPERGTPPRSGRGGSAGGAASGTRRTSSAVSVADTKRRTAGSVRESPSSARSRRQEVERSSHMSRCTTSASAGVKRRGESASRANSRPSRPGCAARNALMPSERASRSARSPSGRSGTAAPATRAKPRVRWARSEGRSVLPKTSASSPRPSRLCISSWKRRSRAVSQPWARNASRTVAAVTVATPRSSNATETLDERPGIRGDSETGRFL